MNKEFYRIFFLTKLEMEINIHITSSSQKLVFRTDIKQISHYSGTFASLIAKNCSNASISYENTKFDSETYQIFFSILDSNSIILKNSNISKLLKVLHLCKDLNAKIISQMIENAIAQQIKKDEISLLFLSELSIEILQRILSKCINFDQFREEQFKGIIFQHIFDNIKNQPQFDKLLILISEAELSERWEQMDSFLQRNIQILFPTIQKQIETKHYKKIKDEFVDQLTNLKIHHEKQLDTIRQKLILYRVFQLVVETLSVHNLKKSQIM